ncbi:MAG: phage protease, partial [Gammaproteobacteria bacterium]
FNKVSAEILFGIKEKGKEFKHVLSGLALLGAELPAVKESGLETAAVFTRNSKPDSVIEFALDLEGEVTYEMLQPALVDIDAAIERQMKGKVGVNVIRAMWKEVKSKVKTIMETKKHSMDAVPPEIQAYADERFQGNVDALLGWVQTAGIAEYEKAVFGKIGGKDLERIREWLEAKTGLKVVNEEVDEMNKEFLAELGLDEQAKDEDVIAAIKKLKDDTVLQAVFEELGLKEGAGVDDIKNALAALKTQSAASSDEVKQFSSRIAVLEKSNKDLTRENRIAYYKEIAGNLRAISGKPEELAEELVGIEESAGEDTVKKLVARYEDQNKRLIAAGIFKANGSPLEGEEDEDHEFTKKVKAYMEEKHVDEATAQAELRKTEPVLFKDMMSKRRVVTRKVEEEE